MVGRELQRIDSIVTQMLRFAAPKAGLSPPCSAHDLLDHSLRLLQHQMGAKMISRSNTLPGRPDAVRGDESQLQQAFMNLLLNAVEAMDNNGILTVTTDIVGRRAQREIHIQDTGMGITPENLAHLFEPFFTTKKNGTGLGLSISRRIGQNTAAPSKSRAKSAVARPSLVSLCRRA